MATIEEQTAQLDDIFNLIKRAQINFKKCPKSRLTKGYLKVRMECVDEYWQRFKDLHITLLKISNKEDCTNLPYFVNDNYQLCEEQYLCLKADMQDLINDLQGEETFHNASTVGSPPHSSMAIDVKLPKIDLPKFSGNYEEWQTFEDTFISLIHNNRSLTDVQRLHYLKSCVTGEASATLRFYQATENNYIPAWDTLRKRYNHKRLIVNAIFKRFFTHKKIIFQSPNQLKLLIDNTRECITSLNNMGLSTATWDSILIYILLQKLDLDTHKEWEDYVSNENDTELPTYKQLIGFLEKRVYTLELTSKLSKSNRDSVRTFYLNTAERLCLYCKENHLLYQCKQFEKLNVEERNEFARHQSLCFNCLFPGHVVMFCKQKFVCKTCGKKHHTLLHEFIKFGTDITSNEIESQSSKASAGKTKENIIKDPVDMEVGLTSHFSAKTSTALLATALVPVKSDSGHVILLRALVDQGSQATFISERAAQLLQLRRTRERDHFWCRSY